MTVMTILAIRGVTGSSVGGSARPVTSTPPPFDWGWVCALLLAAGAGVLLIWLQALARRRRGGGAAPSAAHLCHTVYFVARTAHEVRIRITSDLRDVLAELHRQCPASAELLLDPVGPRATGQALADAADCLLAVLQAHAPALQQALRHVRQAGLHHAHARFARSVGLVRDSRPRLPTAQIAPRDTGENAFPIIVPPSTQ